MEERGKWFRFFGATLFCGARLLREQRTKATVVRRSTASIEEEVR
jgi:hypothetical protein